MSAPRAPSPSVAPMAMQRGGHLRKQAARLQAAGTGGDTVLAHINPEEAALLQGIGGMSINPETGLPEFGFFKKLLSYAAPVVASVVAPGLGTAIGGALGAGATWAPVIGNAAIGAGIGGLTAGKRGMIRGALTGGLTAAALPMLGNAFSSMAPETAASLGIEGGADTVFGDGFGAIRGIGGSPAPEIRMPQGRLAQLAAGPGIANGPPTSLIPPGAMGQPAMPEIRMPTDVMGGTAVDLDTSLATGSTAGAAAAPTSGGSWLSRNAVPVGLAATALLGADAPEYAPPTKPAPSEQFAMELDDLDLESEATGYEDTDGDFAWDFVPEAGDGYYFRKVNKFTKKARGGRVKNGVAHFFEGGHSDRDASDRGGAGSDGRSDSARESDRGTGGNDATSTSDERGAWRDADDAMQGREMSERSGFDSNGREIGSDRDIGIGGFDLGGMPSENVMDPRSGFQKAMDSVGFGLTAAGEAVGEKFQDMIDNPIATLGDAFVGATIPGYSVARALGMPSPVRAGLAALRGAPEDMPEGFQTAEASYPGDPGTRSGIGAGNEFQDFDIATAQAMSQPRDRNFGLGADFMGGGFMLAEGGFVPGIGAMDGRSDKVPAMLSDGEYVIDAETVSMLGNGNNAAGAKTLDRMRKNVRRHKGRALAKGKFSPNAKRPEAYLKKGIA